MGTEFEVLTLSPLNLIPECRACGDKVSDDGVAVRCDHECFELPREEYERMWQIQAIDHHLYELKNNVLKKERRPVRSSHPFRLVRSTE